MKAALRLVESMIFFALLGFSVAKADAASAVQCREILSQHFSMDSHYTVLNEDILNLPDYGNDHVAFSVAVIRKVIGNLGCQRSDINFGKGPDGRSHSNCTLIVRDRDNSRVCYIETNLGYWLVNKDFLENIHVQFHRWD